MIDEVAVPDRLEQAVGEAEGEDVLRRLLAEEVVDAEDLVFGEHLVQLGVQRDRAFQVGAERLLHDDARALDQARLRQQAHRRQGGIGRHAEIVQAPAFVAQFALGLGHRRLERVGAGADRHVVERLGEGGPVGVLHLARGELVERLARDLAEAVGVDLVERDADDPAARDEPGARQVEQAGQQLAPRQVAGGAHQDNDLRMLGTDPRRNLCHACPSPRRAEPPIKLSADSFRDCDAGVQDFSAGRATYLGGRAGGRHDARARPAQSSSCHDSPGYDVLTIAVFTLAALTIAARSGDRA